MPDQQIDDPVGCRENFSFFMRNEKGNQENAGSGGGLMIADGGE